MVGGTWYDVLRLTIDYKFCLDFFFSLILMKELNFFFLVDKHIFRVSSSSSFTFWETATYVQHTLENCRRGTQQKAWKTQENRNTIGLWSNKVTNEPSCTKEPCSASLRSSVGVKSKIDIAMHEERTMTPVDTWLSRRLHANMANLF